MANIEFGILEVLDYNEFVTLKVIENDAFSVTLVDESIGIPLKELFKLNKKNSIDENAKEVLFDIFNKIILPEPRLIDSYKRFADESGINIKTTAEVTPIAESVPAVIVKPVAKPVVKKTTEAKDTKVVKPTKFPRRVGVQEVKEAIEKQNGVATLSQEAMIHSNILKNLHVRINNLLIKNMELEKLGTGEELPLTDPQILAFMSAIKIFNNKTRLIFK